MRDFARSDDPAVQAQLDRLGALSVPDGRLGLETIRALLARLGDPQDRLPPTFHVAGTNGKGSTCAFLRAMLEADGKRVHVATSPHLVRYNERIRIAGKLIEDAQLAALLEEVLDAGVDLNPSFFEVTIAATFLAFAREPADACVVEVGLGGRFDATNVLRADVLAACGIAALGIDHEQFLLAPEDGVPADPIARIAFEKAGIAKPGVPLVTLSYPEGAALEVERAALAREALLAMRGRAWHSSATEAGLHYADEHGELALPLPALPGAHQAENAALAIAMLRQQDGVTMSRDAMARGLRSATWPARLQRLPATPLTGAREVWVDGGHNPSAGEALARHFAGQRFHLILGMLANKDRRALLDPLAGSIASIIAVPVPGHEHHPAEAFGEEARAADSVADALSALPDDGLPVLIAGSLYLAGDVLRLSGALPD
ncbi:MAG: bifunctional folylpolyglutamate synthase/dihydrofolate synthase [Citromicrobium sp.]|nr:bifunctional folylpolyglutamate synthase/dihydrofolate synthase [Citromicrobium sp.]MAO96052.1 bifunctional folylpolyglutamate synthase/dihydrofolate synthase [Citromicrobium sp.]MBD76623.1 bifunctional folylpolyglutamate synthase/dihydrofolate synthase [Citromicrobium sp.]MBT46886.1 bifunctional folylpolyglutamate synthase/dihydrofolate synthase [Citromicrobium sp.]|tara:strand:- start:15100 stop:16395 length:1296 start_codon:yes stop_codon:yes gene_type:complete